MRERRARERRPPSRATTIVSTTLVSISPTCVTVAGQRERVQRADLVAQRTHRAARGPGVTRSRQPARATGGRARVIVRARSGGQSCNPQPVCVRSVIASAHVRLAVLGSLLLMGAGARSRAGVQPRRSRSSRRSRSIRAPPASSSAGSPRTYGRGSGARGSRPICACACRAIPSAPGGSSSSWSAALLAGSGSSIRRLPAATRPTRWSRSRSRSPSTPICSLGSCSPKPRTTPWPPFALLTFEIGGAYAVLPEFSFGARAGFELGLLPWLSARAELWAEHAPGIRIAPSPGTFDATLFAGDVRVCAGGALTRAVRIALCGGPGAGAVHARGRDFASSYAPTGPWFGIVSGLRVAWTARRNAGARRGYGRPAPRPGLPSGPKRPRPTCARSRIPPGYCCVSG